MHLNLFTYNQILLIYIKGPLTITKAGKTTVHGIVSGLGVEAKNFHEMLKRKRTLYFRVATVDALKWIKRLMKKYES